MPLPPYMWLKDGGGADIQGSVDVQDREGSIEIIGMTHGINLSVYGSDCRYRHLARALYLVSYCLAYR